jgi:hypothetical protein
VTTAALVQWHRERPRYSRPNRFRIVRIDEKRCFAFDGRSRKSRQNEDPWIFRILCRNIFLGDKQGSQRHDESPPLPQSLPT